jgi:hypothetical protein
MYYYQHTPTFFQCLLHHPQGYLYHMIKTIVTLFDYRSSVVLYNFIYNYLKKKFGLT